jgi:hypothetical protein
LIVASRGSRPDDPVEREIEGAPVRPRRGRDRGPEQALEEAAEAPDRTEPI